MNKNKFNTSILIRLFKLGFKFRSWFLICIIVSIFFSIFSSYKPICTSYGIDLGVVKKNNFVLIHIICFVSIFTVLEVILQYCLTIYSNLIAQNVIYDLRIRLYRQMIYFKTDFFDRTPNGVLVTRSVSDIETIASVFNEGILMVFGDMSRIVFVILAMFYSNIILAITSLLIILIIYFFTQYFQKILQQLFIDERNACAKLNSFIQERLSGMRLIQLFNRQEIEKKNFQSINNEVTQAHIKTIFIFSLFFPIIELIASIAIGMIIFTGSMMLFYNFNISAGEIVAFVMFINMLMKPIRQIADRFNQIQRGLVGAERVLNLIDTNESLIDCGTTDVNIVKGKIVFKNVYFSYFKNQEVLKGISFSISPGESVAIVGKTGSGKSTIINLLSRLYDVQKGEIYIDDLLLKNFKLKNLRKQISVVLQDVFLFNRSIFENITFGNSTIKMSEVEKAAKIIGVHNFILKLPNGYNYAVSERGNSLSYGQKQIIAFLRAYLYNPSILILDEATSSIDINTEELIQKATERIIQNRTSIIIAHRLATIKNVNRIIVLNSGRIVEEGSHKELLKNKSMYYDLYNSQFN